MSQTSRQHLVLLTTWGSPVGTAYLRALDTVRNLDITVVYDKNEKLHQDILRIYKERFGDKAPEFIEAAKAVSGRPVPGIFIEGYAKPDSIAAIQALKPDWMALAGTSIIKESLLALAPGRVLNCHPGLLPRYRGCTCLEWAIYEDEPAGATCHTVTTEIDAGDIILKQEMPVLKGESYRDLRLKMFQLTAEVMARSVDRLVNQASRAVAEKELFDWSLARYYKPIPENAMAEVLEKIQTGRYRYLATAS